MELLPFATVGSVDDGKSTLIGRLLMDAKQIFEDQLAHVERVSSEKGHDYVNLALLTDGLRAEREQGITIDVAHRYFATPKRRFIIIDAPGHIQYTRNMVTGASHAELAIILIDARNGMTEQTRRHSFLPTLLRVPHLVVAINKMDLVDYSQARFDEIQEEFSDFATRLDIKDLTFFPISALKGDNVVTRSEKMPWYDGRPLLRHLEEVYIGSDRNLIDARFPVQYVIRPMSDAHHDYRGYAGTLASGVLRKGDEVVALPSGMKSRIKAIESSATDDEIDEAFAPMAITVRLEDELDISRGDMLCRPNNQPMVSQDIDAMVCWLSPEVELSPRKKYLIKQTTRWGKTMVKALDYRVDINTGSRDESAASLSMNEIGRVKLRSATPFFFDEYSKNRQTGSFILVDEQDHFTVGAGMILGTSHRFVS
jgi:sulfate adenylyltransferase large subunit